MNAVAENIQEVENANEAGAGTSLVPAGQKVVALKNVARYNVFENALILDPSIKWAEFERAARTTQQMEQGSPWWLGDLQLQGELLFAEKMEQAFDIRTPDNPGGMTVKTLQNMKWVSKKWEVNRRRPGVEWAVHEVLAGQTVEMQEAWMNYAVREGVDRNGLRKAIADAKAKGIAPNPDGTLPTPVPAGREASEGDTLEGQGAEGAEESEAVSAVGYITLPKRTIQIFEALRLKFEPEIGEPEPSLSEYMTRIAENMGKSLEVDFDNLPEVTVSSRKPVTNPEVIARRESEARAKAEAAEKKAAEKAEALKAKREAAAKKEAQKAQKAAEKAAEKGNAEGGAAPAKKSGKASKAEQARQLREDAVAETPSQKTIDDFLSEPAKDTPADEDSPDEDATPMPNFGEGIEPIPGVETAPVGNDW